MKWSFHEHKNEKSFCWCHIRRDCFYVVAELILSHVFLFSLPTLEYLSVANFIWFAPHFIVVLLCVFVAASLGGRHQSV